MKRTASHRSIPGRSTTVNPASGESIFNSSARSGLKPTSNHSSSTSPSQWLDTLDEHEETHSGYYIGTTPPQGEFYPRAPISLITTQQTHSNQTGTMPIKANTVASDSITKQTTDTTNSSPNEFSMLESMLFHCLACCDPKLLRTLLNSVRSDSIEKAKHASPPSTDTAYSPMIMSRR